MQAAASLDERKAGEPGRHQARPESELLTELDALGLLNEQRIGPAVDVEPLDLFAEHDAADARARFEQGEWDVLPLKLVRGRQPGHPAADYQDLSRGGHESIIVG